MPLVLAVLTLFAGLMAADADAATDAERLAKKFSHLLILTEDTELSDWQARARHGSNKSQHSKAAYKVKNAYTQTVQDDSLQVENGQAEKPPVLLGNRIANGIRVLGRGEQAAGRIFAKVGVGALSGAAFTAIGFVVIANIHDSSKDLAGAGYLLLGAAIGSSVGFPLGVTAVDPYDFLPMTLLAGVIPGTVGTALMWAGDFETGSLLAYVTPLITSLIASELSRQPPQDRRVSFGLSPTSTGGLSAAATLRF